MEERERGELMAEKLKRGVLVGRREGISTPSPTWKFGSVQPDGTLIPDFDFPPNLHSVSARKLGANLWDMEAKFNRRAEKSSVNEPVFAHHRLQVNDAEAVKSPSKQMAPQRSVMSPTSSSVCNSKFGESSRSLKTSTELLKVLNRIWSLEEKHALDMSLVKTLRKELEQSKSRIQELMQEKKRDKNEVSSLMKELREYKVARKKEHEAKLEDELKSRRHSEKRHHKLTKELSEIKSSFSNALRELERERKARVMLENLCDSFAKGIRDYEQELRVMKHTSCTDQIGREGNDRLVLHISEAWLDERTQMKFADACDVSEKQSALDKLCLEIECFLQEKQDASLKSPRESNILPHCLESFHLNEPASAPWNVNDEDDSIGVINHRPETKAVNRKQSSKSRTENLEETRNPRLPRKGDMMQRSIDADGDLEDTKRRHGYNCMESSFDPSTFAGPPSPVKKWNSEAPVTGPDISESSSKWTKTPTKPNTLKAKLMEARQERQQSRTRASKSSSQGD